jgi:predicted TPR repeat methyltransferase
LGARDQSALVRNAVAAFQSGRFQEAEAGFEQVLAADSRNFDAMHLLGIIHAQHGRLQQALETFDKAIAINPARAGAHDNRGVALQQLGRFEEALASHDRALAINPKSADTLSKRGLALHALGRLDEALASLDRAVAISPYNPDIFHNRGNTLSALKRFDEAVASYDKAIALQPINPESLNGRGNAFTAQRRFDEALACYDRAIVLRPDYADALSNAGTVLIEMGEFDKACAALRRALLLNPNLAEAHINLGLALAQQGKLEEASAAAKAAARFAARPSFPHYTLGALFAKCGMTKEACAQFNACLAADPSDREGARMFLASLGAEPMPGQASDALIAEKYGSWAASWDLGVTGPNAYRGADLVARAIDRVAPAAVSLDVLDAGCGTGLVGMQVRHRARRLEGVDLSPAMLAKAKEKKIYDTLVQGDLLRLLADRRGSYDLVTAAASLPHFGDLRPVFDAVAMALRDGGLFVFTVFPNEHNDDAFAVGTDDGLIQVGCYTHGGGYIARTAAASGFEVALLDRDVHEFQHGKPRIGLVAALRRQSTGPR